MWRRLTPPTNRAYGINICREIRNLEEVMASRNRTRPDWLDDDLFPFESRFVDLDGNTVHYVDEGEGPTILMYHGNPTWSFLYRDMIAGLRDRFRCIAFDYPGFGLSKPSSDYPFTYKAHLEVSAAFVESLALDQVTVFVQDWGGPIGLGVAAQDPDRYHALVIGNTFAWPADQLSWKAVSALLGGPVGKLVIDRGNFLARSVGSSAKLRKMSSNEAMHYTAPFPTRQRRKATRRFIAQIRGARPDLQDLAAALPSLGDLPTLFFWGTKDPFYGERDLARLQSLFPNHTTQVLEGAGHFIQSEAGGEIATTIRDWFRDDLNPGH